MKPITPLKMIVILTLTMLSTKSRSQNYDFALIQNSDYNFTLAAVSQFDSGSFEPRTQSYGFVLVLPDGFTITVDQVLPSGTNETVTPIPGTNVAGLDASMADKDLFLITTDTSGGTLSAHGSGETIPLVTFTVNGAPTSGEIRLLENDSNLASHPAINGALDAFIQADITDDATVNFTNEFNMVSGTNAYSFETLSTEEIDAEILNISLYPNPAKDEVYIKGNTNDLSGIELYDINGKQVLVQTHSFERIDISQLESGVYLVKLKSIAASSKTIKLVKH
ncbi:T9SS type A sorting domain-containing protein [Psychroserpens luteolus]|uniref:T9SS type A sorting domain-containing protein n=1 Tax=Psychroserpens luteolus TaxID=2855840 RepID=UPI001E59C457|nr:T9SS type A sorting domain-containing protein [Psychroserpens luteolus]MCD2259448.1 T9SS type A sorting domain-containing protein [Psychroserpens luteolus]